ncbi:hypothetical protein CISIN_1g0420482mg, partial [Citrus sinensis]
MAEIATGMKTLMDFPHLGGGLIVSLEVGDWDGHQKRSLLIDHGLFEVIM